MFSIADMAVAGAVALLLFGPDQLPKVARRAGQLVRDVQNTSQSFIREMERAADTTPDSASAGTTAPAFVPSAPLYHETPEPADHALVARETALEGHGPVDGAAGLPTREPAIAAPGEGPLPASAVSNDGAFAQGAVEIPRPAGLGERTPPDDRSNSAHLPAGEPAP